MGRGRNDVRHTRCVQYSAREMTETSRPTALGVARSRFVEGLPRKSQELRGSLALLVGSPAEERTREELRRRLHALWASAQVFQIDALSEALKDAITRLDAARDEKRPLSQDDLDGLAALAATLPLLGAQTAPVQHALASSPPAPALLRTSAEFRRTGIRPPSASRVGMAAVVELETLYVVGAAGNLGQRAKAMLNGEPRIEVVVSDSPQSALDACGPDILLIAPSDDSEALRRAAARVGTAIRVIGAEGVGSLPALDAEGFVRALKMGLRTLPELETHHAATRMSDLEVQLWKEGEVRTRFDGMSAARLVGRIGAVSPNATLRMRDAHDAIEAEVRGGVLVDVIRTMSDGSFVRGAKALVPFLGMRRGLLTVELNERAARVTLKDPAAALEVARLHLAAVAHAAHPSRIQRVHEVVLDEEAAPAARKERAVEARVLDALTRTRHPAELIGAGTSAEGVGAAVVALARAGAVTAIHGVRGEDLLAESLEVVRALPKEEEPDVRTLTAVPPAPVFDDEPQLSVGASDESEEEEDDTSDDDDDDDASDDDDDDASDEDEDDDASDEDEDDDADEEEAEDEPRVDDTVKTEAMPAEPAAVEAVAAKAVVHAPEMRAPEAKPKAAEPVRVERREEPEAKPESSSSTFLWLFVVACLFIAGFVLWRAIQPAVETPVVAPVAAVDAAVIAVDAAVPAVEVQAPTPEVVPPPRPAGMLASFGEVVVNPEAPPADTGWILAGDEAIQVEVDGALREVPAGGQLAVSLGLHQVTFADESLRFVVVRADQAVRVSAPR